ncbi:MAG: ATPase, T2SS/T4P/T4SS family, partial [Pyrinomonadaceae bacterium]
MEKLNEYLQTLLSSCSDELRLEPDKNPYLVAKGGPRDVSNLPVAGTQISMMVFPLIPPEVKAVLPHNSEVEFVHPHSLGNFNFTIQKSPAGFIVTIRPVLGDSTMKHLEENTDSEAFPAYLAESAPLVDAVEENEPSFDPPRPTVSNDTYDLDSSSANHDVSCAAPAKTASVSDLIYDKKETAKEYVPADEPKIEILSFNDPEYQTVFSDTAAHERPGRRDDLISNAYEPPPPPVAPVAEPSLTNPAFNPAVSVKNLSTGKMDELFQIMSDVGASDLHLSVSMPPMVRRDGRMKTLRDSDAALTAESMRQLLTPIMSEKNREEFEARHDTDFAYEIPDLARFRCNVFMDRKGMGGVFRIIPTKILTAEQLGLSKAIMDLCSLSKGLVVVTGPTGSGKSTTLCAMVDSINKNREDHIITIEDPI